MADVITLSDDDFSPPAIQNHAVKQSKSGHSESQTANQWNVIFSQRSHQDRRNHGHKSVVVMTTDRLSHRSSGHSSQRPSEKSARHSDSGRSSHRSSEHSSQRSSEKSSRHSDSGRSCHRSSGHSSQRSPDKSSRYTDSGRSSHRSSGHSSQRPPEKSSKHADSGRSSHHSSGSQRPPEKSSKHADSGRSSHHSSGHSSQRSPEKSSRQLSHRPSERHLHQHSSSRGDTERRRRERSSSSKSVIELDISGDDANSSSKYLSERYSESSKESLNDRATKSSNQHSEGNVGHRHPETSTHHRLESSNHHSGKASSKSSPIKKTSEKTSTTSVPENISEKNVAGKSVSESNTAGREEAANGRHSGSRRSLAAELGVSKAECRKDDEPSALLVRRVTNGEHAKPSPASTSQFRSSQSKRSADDGGEAVVLVKRVRLTHVTPETSSGTSSPAPEPKTKQSPKSAPEPEPCPCQQSLEVVCALLKPLLSGSELKLEAKVRRRHAAVLAVAGGRSARKQHLTGATEQCAERLRAEPERCFTVLRGFLEQLDQIKIVASSAQSRTGPAPAAAAGKTASLAAAANKMKTAVNAVKALAVSTVTGVKKTAVTDAAKTSPSAPMPVNGSASLAAASEQEEKKARRHRRHVAKLEKTLRRLEREIVRQDEQEVDWEDAAGSAYIVGARLKRRYVQVYRFYCQLVGAADEAQRLDSRRIRFDGTPYPEINRRIEKFVNQTREFPDFKDVLSLIETANRRDRLQLRPGALRDQAKEAFLQLGALLQKRRRAALAESMDSLAGAEEWRSRDPSAGDASLGGRLAENAASGKERLNEVFREFVQRQETAAAERRQKRADAADGSGGDDDEEEEEGDESEEAEESEVTDEELEQLPRPPMTGGDARDSDGSGQDQSPTDVEMAETEDGEMKEGGVEEEKKERGSSDSKTEGEVGGEQKVERSVKSAAGEDTGNASGTGPVSEHSNPTASADRDSAGSREHETSEVKTASREDDPDWRGEPESGDKGSVKTTVVCGATPDGSEPEPRTGYEVSEKGESSKNDHVKEPEISEKISK